MRTEDGAFGAFLYKAAREILDKEEYAICEKKMAEKYGLPENSVFLGTDPDDPDSSNSLHTNVSIHSEKEAKE